MAKNEAFEWVCDAIEGATTLDRLEARGTMRLALKAAGLDAREVSADQLGTVLTRVLPSELETRGIADAPTTCERIALDLSSQNLQTAGSGGDSPENVFARLGGN